MTVILQKVGSFYRRLSKECGFAVSPHRYGYTLATELIKALERNLQLVNEQPENAICKLHDGIPLEEAILSLTGILVEHVSQEQYDINLDSPSLQASRELREWIKRRLIVERGGRIFATDALEGAITFVESLDNTKLRAERLLPPGNWPLCLPIGKPSAKIFPEQTQRVLQHVQLWRQVIVGRVEWEEVKLSGERRTDINAVALAPGQPF